MEIKEIRAVSGLSRPNFARKYNIPYRTLQSWEVGERKCPEYAKDWLKRIVEEDKEEGKMCEKLVNVPPLIEAGVRSQAYVYDCMPEEEE